MSSSSLLAERLAQADLEDLPDWQAADALNAPDPAQGTVRIAVPTFEARGVLLTSGEWAGIVMAAENPEVPAQVRGVCILLRDTLTMTEELNLDRPERHAATVAALEALVSAALLTSATRDALLALAERPRSWAEANGITVDARAVGLARGATP